MTTWFSRVSMKHLWHKNVRVSAAEHVDTPLVWGTGWKNGENSLRQRKHLGSEVASSPTDEWSPLIEMMLSKRRAFRSKPCVCSVETCL